MITPTWENFPNQHSQAEPTQFLFQIPNSRVEVNLCSLEPSILVFLRGLERIELKRQLNGNRTLIGDAYPNLDGEVVSIVDISVGGIASE